MRNGRYQVAVITGPSGGVGRATARLLAERGIKIALLARGEAGLSGAVEDVAAIGGQPLAIETDMADYDQVEEIGRAHV